MGTHVVDHDRGKSARRFVGREDVAWVHSVGLDEVFSCLLAPDVVAELAQKHLVAGRVSASAKERERERGRKETDDRRGGIEIRVGFGEEEGGLNGLIGALASKAPLEAFPLEGLATRWESLDVADQVDVARAHNTQHPPSLSFLCL